LHFLNKAVITLKNDISLAGDIDMKENFCFIKQSQKSNALCIVPYHQLKNTCTIEGKKLDLCYQEKTIRFHITDEEVYVRLNGGITLFGFIAYSDELSKILSEGVLLCINRDMEIFYYIPNDEIARKGF